MQSRRPGQQIRPLSCVLCLVFLGIIGLLIAILIVSVQNETPTPPPSPPPPTLGAGECDWCDDLRQRVNFPDEEHLTNSTSVSACIRAGMNAECTSLYQSDFANGTFLAETDDACYMLHEDIVFDPAPWADYRASEVAPYKDIAAFTLDFFAAFAVSAKGVTLDLNGHEMRQSHAHHLKQRFFAVIEVADRPFLRGQGPADFSGSSPGAVAPARGFTLMNGKIGMSSHHGVHGNDAQQVLIVDVELCDYEIAAIHLNGARDVVLNNVRAHGTLLKVPVIGTYSSFRFMGPFVTRLLGVVDSLGSPSSSVTTAANTLEAAWTHLSTLAAQAEDDIIGSGLPTVDHAAHPEAHALFGNPSGLVDGNTYGIIMHVKGVAVNGFECDSTDPRHDLSSHILIEECEVSNTRANVNEVVGIRDIETGILNRGPAGDILRIQDITNPSTGAYEGTALSDTKIALHELMRALGLDRGDPGTGTTHMHPFVVAWSRGSTTMLRDKIASGDLEPMRNGDSMFHVNKGVFGIRISGGRYVCIDRTRVINVENHGANGEPVPLPGETAESAYYIGASDGGHPAQAPQRGYMGADAYGISADAVNDLIIRSVIVRDVFSRYMWARGAAFFNDAKRPHIRDITVMNISAFTVEADQHMTHSSKLPQAAGLYTANDADVPEESGYVEIGSVRTGKVGLASEKLHASTGIDKCSEPEANWFGA